MNVFVRGMGFPGALVDTTFLVSLMVKSTTFRLCRVRLDLVGCRMVS